MNKKCVSCRTAPPVPGGKLCRECYDQHTAVMLAAPSPAESFTLAATTAAAARREAVQRFPQGGSLKGYVEGDSEAVYLSSVREKGNKTYVATAFRNRAPRPTRFVFEPSSK